MSSECKNTDRRYAFKFIIWITKLMGRYTTCVAVKGQSAPGERGREGSSGQGRA